jgi:transposase
VSRGLNSIVVSSAPQPRGRPTRIQHHRLCLADRNDGVGAVEAGQAANLAGLAPIARQSGRWTGHSFIHRGRADVRQALYMPALAAARFNPDIKAKYAHLIETGKLAKVALTAIMRKLVVLANALLKANRRWTPRTAWLIRIL